MAKVVLSRVRGAICRRHSGDDMTKVVLSRVRGAIFGLFPLSPAARWPKSGFGGLFFAWWKRDLWLRLWAFFWLAWPLPDFGPSDCGVGLLLISSFSGWAGLCPPLGVHCHSNSIAIMARYLVSW